jgi:hypothetical protein
VGGDDQRIDAASLDGTERRINIRRAARAKDVGFASEAFGRSFRVMGLACGVRVLRVHQERKRLRLRDQLNDCLHDLRDNLGRRARRGEVERAPAAGPVGAPGSTDRSALARALIT